MSRAGSSKKKRAGGKSSSNRLAPPVKTGPPPQAAPVPPVNNPPQDLVTAFWLRFGRFGWDVAGIGLIAFALLTLVGLLGRIVNQPWAQGILLSLWVRVISQAFGWGWPVAVLAIGLLGFLFIRRRFTNWPNIPLGRVLALEGLAFCLLALLSLMNGWSLERVEAGKDGGFIGWGLATLLDRILPSPWGGVFLIVCMIFFAGYGSGFIGWFLARMESWLNQVTPADQAKTAAPDSPAKLKAYFNGSSR